MIRHASFVGSLILTFLAACDNVSWGGADVTIVPPPPKASGSPAPGVEPGAERAPEGPVLYHVVATTEGGRITPVAEISGDTLLPLRPISDARAYGDVFVAANLQPGSEFVLFHDGIRAGTFVAQSATVAATACTPGPRGTGLLELSAGAQNVREFLAIAKVQAPQIQRRGESTLEPTRTMRLLAPILADGILRSRGSPLPTNWERALAQLQPFPVAGAQDPAFVATFLVGDTLGPGLDDAGQSLFFVAMPARMGYDTVFVEFRDYATTGKAAPHLIDFLDWNGDEVPDLLIRVFGVTDEWYEAVARTDDRWRVIFSDRCARPIVAPAQDPIAGDTMLIDTTQAVPPDTAS